MNRNPYYDILRVTAMLLVIGVHGVGSIEQYVISSFGKTEVLILDRLNTFGVPIFFAISGAFLLDRTYESVFKFYKIRLINIGIPYLVYAVIYVVYFTGYEQGNIIGIPISYLVDLLTAKVHPTHWFVYTIAALSFITPFLSKMVNNLKDWELFIMISGCLVFLILKHIFSIFDLSFGIETLYFETSSLYLFLIGYSARRLSRQFKPLMIVKRFRVIITILFVLLFLFTGISFFQTIAVFLLMMEVELKNNGILCGWISKLALCSYSIYLIHAAVISFVLKIYTDWESFFEIKVLLVYPVVLMISLLITRVIDFFVTDRIKEAATRRW